MSNLDYRQFAERHRPHIHPPGAVLFVTYRLAGSIPRATVREYKAKRGWLEDQLTRARKMKSPCGTPELNKWLERVEKFNRESFSKFEEVLHKASVGPMWMRNERVADAVAQGLHKLDGDAYTLDAYCVVSNHVHTVFKPSLSERELREGFDEGGHLVPERASRPLPDYAFVEGFEC